MIDLTKVEEIYHAALEKPLAERDAFMREACGADAELRREVESLLSFDEKAQDFIASPPDDLAAAIVGSSRRNGHLIGQEFNHYRVLSLLGAGGMGEIYLAEDKKLGRKIALKLLPPQFSSNIERKARFLQEARAASALNHPNIITIYGVEEFDNLNFIATEFIEGETLRERLARGPLSVAETLDIAVQIASALEAAHSVGVVHRDIKPANIMLRRDRIVKVLDFGLAKFLAAGGANHFESRDLSGHRRVMGTISYMSPEQALGEKIDARTDIFSFGVVLYEMLTGVQPFGGNSEAAIYDAILNRDALLLAKEAQNLPPDLAEIIGQMMKKEAAERFQTAAQVRAALERVRQRINTGEAVALARPFTPKIKLSRGKVAALAATAAILLAVVLLLLNRRPDGAAPRALGNINYTQLTKLSGAELFPSLAPDGKTFLFSSRAEGNWDIFLQRVGGSNAVNLTKDSKADERQAVYSPDGASVAFRSERDGGGIFLMGATGENVKRLTDFGFYPSWSPDGAQVVFSSEDFVVPMDRGTISFLWVVKVATGEKRRLTEQDAIQPNWSPSGARIAFWKYEQGGQRDIWTISAAGGSPLRVTNDAYIDWNPVWSPDGKYLYFVSDRGGSMNLWRTPVDEATGKVLGEPETITTPSTFTQHLSFSRDGRAFTYVQSVNYSNIVKANFNPSVEKVAAESSAEITHGALWATNPEISSDGEGIVFDNIGDKQEDVFLIKPDGTGLRQLTNDSYKDRTPRWSPDGKQIAFFSDRSGRYDAWVINADGSNLRQLTHATDKRWVQLPVWSPDGRKLLFNRSFAVPIIFDASATLENQTPQELTTANTTNSWVMMNSWSPDGKKLAGYIVSNGSGDSGIYVYAFDTRRYEKLSDFGTRPVWLNDSRRLLFYEKDKIYALDSQTKKIKEVLSVAPNRLQHISVSKDNKTIFYSLQKTEADVWLGSFR